MGGVLDRAQRLLLHPHAPADLPLRLCGRGSGGLRRLGLRLALARLCLGHRAAIDAIALCKRVLHTHCDAPCRPTQRHALTACWPPTAARWAHKPIIHYKETQCRLQKNGREADMCGHARVAPGIRSFTRRWRRAGQARPLRRPRLSFNDTESARGCWALGATARNRPGGCWRNHPLSRRSWPRTGSRPWPPGRPCPGSPRLRGQRSGWQDVA